MYLSYSSPGGPLPTLYLLVQWWWWERKQPGHAIEHVLPDWCPIEQNDGHPFYHNSFRYALAGPGATKNFSVRLGRRGVGNRMKFIVDTNSASGFCADREDRNAYRENLSLSGENRWIINKNKIQLIISNSSRPRTGGRWGQNSVRRCWSLLLVGLSESSWTLVGVVWRTRLLVEVFSFCLVGNSRKTFSQPLWLQFRSYRDWVWGNCGGWWEQIGSVFPGVAEKDLSIGHLAFR